MYLQGMCTPGHGMVLIRYQGIIQTYFRETERSVYYCIHYFKYVWHYLLFFQCKAMYLGLFYNPSILEKIFSENFIKAFTAH